MFFAETPILVVFSAKHAKLKETHKEKNTRFVSRPVLTALVKMSLFSAFFILFFLQFPNFSETFLIGSQKSKNYKIPKQQKQKKTTRKQDTKQKVIKHDDSKQNKTASRKRKTK